MKALVHFLFPTTPGLEYTYLEIGVCLSETLNVLAPLFDHTVCVDIMEGYEKRIRKDCNVTSFTKSSEDFLNEEGKDYEYDFVFIDADHRGESALRDFEMVFPMVKEGGYIVLHDSYPPDEMHLGLHLCGTVWETAELLSKFETVEGYPYEVVTLSGLLGLTIIRKRSRHLTWRG